MRFIHFAVFDSKFLSLHYYLVDYMVCLVFGFLGFRLMRVTPDGHPLRLDQRAHRPPALAPPRPYGNGGNAKIRVTFPRVCGLNRVKEAVRKTRRRASQVFTQG